MYSFRSLLVIELLLVACLYVSQLYNKKVVVVVVVVVLSSL